MKAVFEKCNNREDVKNVIKSTFKQHLIFEDYKVFENIIKLSFGPNAKVFTHTLLVDNVMLHGKNVDVIVRAHYPHPRCKSEDYIISYYISK